MFANDLVVKDNSAVDHTFKLIQLDGSTSDRVDPTSTRVLPSNLRIKRQAGTGPKAVDRYLVQFTRTLLGTAGAVPVIANVTFAVPRDGAVSNNDVKDLAAYIRNFLTSSNVEELLLGSI